MIIHGSLGQTEVLSVWLLGTTDTSTTIYTVPKPIGHIPGVSLSLIISGQVIL